MFFFEYKSVKVCRLPEVSLDENPYVITTFFFLRPILIEFQKYIIENIRT